jgi:hypothetical protein
MHSSFKRLRVSGRRAAVLAAAGVVALVASGCASFTSAPTGTQLAPNGDVTVTSNICLFSFASGLAAYEEYYSYGDGPFANTPPSCDNTYEPEISEIDESGQLLMAYEVPASSTAGAVSSPELPGVTFAQNSDYVDWLNNNGPVIPDGYKWVGYMSSPFTVSGGLNLTTTAEFTPAASPAGQPNTTPYAVDMVVVGDRINNAVGYDSLPFPTSGPLTVKPAVKPADDSGTTLVDLDPNRPLDCSAFEPPSSPAHAAFGGAKTPAVSPATLSDSAVSTDCVEDYTQDPTDITTRSLTSTAPSSPISVVAGNTATIPFTVQYNGPSADPFMLSASTNSNALIATPANLAYTPSGTGNTVENVTVPVPAGLTPGTYTVTLNVGAFGSTAATLKVTAPAITTTTTGTTTTPVNPQQAPAISGLSINSALTVSLKLNIDASERLTLRDKHGKHWSTLKTLTVKGSAGNNVLKLKNLFGSLVDKIGHYQITVQAFANNLSSAPQTLSFTVSSKGSHRRA